MSDWADLAAEREQQLRDDALARHTRERAAERASAATCAVCDEPIPAARRAALPGVVTCIDCARELEAALPGATRRPGKDPR